MLILAEDCWLSFFTVPVFRSNILPLKANTSPTLLRRRHRGANLGDRPGCARFWTCVVVLCGGELLPELLPVVRVQLVIEGRAEPIGLRLVEDGRHRVRDVNNAPSFAGNHKQKAVGCLQYEMLQLLRERDKCFTAVIPLALANLINPVEGKH